MASTWVYLIRHGEVEHAAARRFLGHADVPLSPVGREQAEALARTLGSEAIEAVYASDLVRAQASAAPLAAARRRVPELVPALREIALGRWDGLTFAEMEAREPDTVRRWLADAAGFVYPGGESLRDLHARVLPALRTLVARHAGRRIAVVAHSGTNRVILGEALGVPLGEIVRIGQVYGAWSLVEYGDDAPIVHTLNQPVAVPGAPPVDRG